jgi:hypothetical protein
MKFTAMIAMAVTMVTGLRAQETDPIVKALDNREVAQALMKIFKQTSFGFNRFEAAFRLDGNAQHYHVQVELPSHAVMAQRVGIQRGVTYAIFHVHPNNCDPAPSPHDRDVANKYQVKMLTLHRSGLYEYDPVSQKTTKLRSGIRWLLQAAAQQVAANFPDGATRLSLGEAPTQE